MFRDMNNHLRQMALQFHAYGKKLSCILNHRKSCFMVPEDMDINLQVHRTFASFCCPWSLALQHKSGLEATVFLCQNCMECTKRSGLGIYVCHSYLEITGKRTWPLLALHRCSSLKACCGSGVFNQNSTLSEATALWAWLLELKDSSIWGEKLRDPLQSSFFAPSFCL